MKKNKSNCIFISLILLLTFAVGLSFAKVKNSTASQTVQASSRLKREYIPKRFRGTWYANKHDKMKITANSVGGNVVGKTYTKFYHGGYKDVDVVSKHNLVRYQEKSMIILFEKGGSDTTFRVVNRHHRKALYFQQGGGYIYFYRSRAAAKRYGNY
ncbi:MULTISPECIES: hypothetical protein [Lactobacillus]|uniref:Uncharacterized protein n=3 Tax=Lactobacillus TaxID=1578 RepID=A0AAV4E306_LACHE|nr:MULTISPECIES: hypothetical protein [Lactobacillus]AGQ23948.1 hypothetical protein lhe_1496 [Lactobacillus helveticus CNRZ32]AUI75841.1 hypothetical protein Lh22155_03220 [Lactobacillus helveticus]EFG55994.1 hypothetical protein HMPREF0493_0457 [Lactobacillus amylolyticus DSM 11664]KRL18999.1 hypothetical protein FD39_GL001571 [Lactobacillus amylolyticus DSM 11664]KRL21747.1 hypothetical protein FC37_GL001235 [Lactobacillus gallinarum DSM 10532 = JCM 2011]